MADQKTPAAVAAERIVEAMILRARSHGTIWMARCHDCGLEQRRKSEPRLRGVVHCDGFCHNCVHPIEWQRWEVEERVEWDTVWFDESGDELETYTGFQTRKAAEACGKRAAAVSGEAWKAKRVVRRTLRRERG